jgi:hypothetical protein
MISSLMVTYSSSNMQNLPPSLSDSFLPIDSYFSLLSQLVLPFHSFAAFGG